MEDFIGLPPDPELAALLIESLDSGFAVVDADGKFRVWNSANTKILGKGIRPDLSPEEWPAYYGMHCPLEKRLLRVEELPLTRAIESREPVEQDLLLIHEGFPQGRWIKVYARPLLNDSGILIGCIAIIRDLTSERLSLLSNQMMAEFFSSGDDAIFGVNLQGIVLLWNPGAERMFGWKSEEMVGFSAYRMVPPDRHWEIERILQIASSGKQLPPLETEVLGKDGRKLSVSRSITAMLDEKGQPMGMVVVARDISLLKQAELELEDSYRQLRLLSARQQHLLEQQLADLARDLHDEFGQQLAAVKFELAWLERHLAEDSQVEERLDSLNQQLKSTMVGLRRLSKQMRPPLMEELGLSHSLEQLSVDLCGGLEVDLDCSMDTLQLQPEAALALYRIAQEALTNVVRHAAASQVRLSLLLEADEIKLLISDNGRGLPLDHATTGEHFGIRGMQERALTWGGQLRVAGAQSSGTEVSAEFPLSRVARPDQGSQLV